MLFDLSPKLNRRDFYNFELELEQFNKLFNNSRIIAIVGPRRAGKTSLILTFLNEHRVPHIFIDCRRVALSTYGASFRGFVEEFSRALNEFIARHRNVAERLLSYLRSVRGVEIDLSGARVLLKWGRRDRLDIFGLLDKINLYGSEENLRIAIVFDELQELQPLNIDFSKLLAYIYDHLRSLVVIVSGSQVGLLYDVLNIDDPQSPLYGRAIAELPIGRLPRDKAVDFLLKGFEEIGVKIDQNIIEKAVSMLDGLIGWLTYFGWSYMNGVRDVEAILDLAAAQEAEEIKRFLSRSRSEKRYREILKIIAKGINKWGEIKKALEFIEGVEIDDKNFSELLKRLIKAGFIEKRNDAYYIVDSITLRAIQKYL